MKRSPQPIRAWLPAVRLLLILAGALPFLTWWLIRLELHGGLVTLARSWFELQCHGVDARSLRLLDQPFPVCARCLGIYAGLAVGGAFGRGVASWRTLWIALMVGATLMVLDVLTERAGLRPPLPALRVVTGLVFACPAGVALVRWARGDHPPTRHARA